MIKRGPISLKRLCHDDAWLYCATLTHENKYDWRFPTFGEYVYDPNAIAGVWHANRDGNNRTSFSRYAQPVRTIDD